MSLVKVKGSVLENSVASLADLPVYAKAGETINVNHFYADVEGGGGIFVWADEAKSTHNGGTIIDPSHPSAPSATGWWTANGSGNGVWKRQYDGAVNVKWFGAKSDGNFSTGAGTDCSVAINAAIGSIPVGTTTDGHAVYIPPGMYLVENPIEIPSGMSVIGAGKWATILFCKNAYASNVIHLNGVGGYPTRLSGVAVNAQIGGAYSATGVLAAANGSFINDIWINGFGQGLRITSTDIFVSEFAIELNTTGIYVASTNVNIEQGTLYQNAYGLTCDNSSSSEVGTLVLSDIRSTEDSTVGFNFSQAHDVQINNCSVSSSLTAKYSLAAIQIADNSSKISIVGFHAKYSIQSSVSSAVLIKDTSSYIDVLGCMIVNFGSGVTISSAGTNLNVSNNNISNCYLHGIYSSSSTPAINITNNIVSYIGDVGVGDTAIKFDTASANQTATIVGNLVTQSGGGNCEYGISVNCGHTPSTIKIFGNSISFANTSNYNITGTYSNQVYTEGNEISNGYYKNVITSGSVPLSSTSTLLTISGVSYQGCYIKIAVSGTLQGVGQYGGVREYLVNFNTGTPTITPVSYTENGTSGSAELQVVQNGTGVDLQIVNSSGAGSYDYSGYYEVAGATAAQIAG